MSTVLSHWMTLFISVIIMFTPILAYADSLNQEAVDTVIYEACKKASVEGAFTPEIQDEIKKTLEEKYGFDPDMVTIDLTQTTTMIQERGTYIKITVNVERGPIFVLDMLNQGPKQITKTREIMSEYIIPY